MKELSPIDRLEILEKAALGNARLNALKEVDCPTIREIMNCACSPDLTFGLKKLPDPNGTLQAAPRISNDLWWPELADLLETLAKRQYTGNTARGAVSDFLARCTDLQRKWSERILLQDLRLSIGAKDVNKALGSMVVRVFSIPLAKPFKELKDLKGEWYLQLKMDGARVISEIDNKGKVKLLSRSGKEWGSSFDSIKDSVRRIAEEFALRSVVLDGEVAIWEKGRMDFQEMQKMFFPKDGRKPNGAMKYTLFDMAPVEEYFDPQTAYEDRLYKLQTTLKASGLPKNVDIIQSEHLINPEQKYLDDKAIEYVEKYGCDGAIIRRANKAPTNRKSSDITKVKPFEDGEAFIRGKVEGKGHLKGSLGTMVCELIVNKKASGIMFEIGTGEGLTKELRQELWDDPELTMKIVSFKFQRLTDDGVPLLPTYRGIRHPDDM